MKSSNRQITVSGLVNFLIWAAVEVEEIVFIAVCSSLGKK